MSWYAFRVVPLADPQPFIKSDGKAGYTPAAGEQEWVDADVPPWSDAEDYTLLYVRNFKTNFWLYFACL